MKGVKCREYPDDEDNLKTNPMLTHPMKEYVYPIDDSHVHTQHEEFVKKFGKEKHEEGKNNFRHNLRYINSMNRRNLTFKLKVNYSF